VDYPETVVHLNTTFPEAYCLDFEGKRSQMIGRDRSQEAVNSHSSIDDYSGNL